MNIRKAAMIGCGFVGASSAFALMQSGIFSEMVMIDADHAKAEGEAMDLSHGLPFARPVKIYAGDYDDIVDAGIIIITAGANQKPDETRLDLIHKNVEIYKQIIPKIAKRGCEGILLIVSNPVDILTYTALKLSGFPEHRVIGSGTVLDTARLKYLIGEYLGVDNRSVHAFIIGEHGDSELAAWSNANISGVRLSDFCEMRGHFMHEESENRIYEKVRNSAYEIIERKRATYYGIAMAVKRICECIIRNEQSILPVSSMMHGIYGMKDIVISMPAIVGKDGVENVIPISLDEEEKMQLKRSADILTGMKEMIKKEHGIGPVKDFDNRTLAGKRRALAQTKAPEAMMTLLNTALSAGLKADYVLFDSWFSNPAQVTAIHAKGMDVIAMIKKSSRIKYSYGGEQLNIKEIYSRNKKRRGRSKYLLSVDVMVGKANPIPAKIVCVRNKANRKDWLAFICTATTLSEEEIIRIYGKRWQIEVFFKTCKSMLNLVGECHSLSYDALTAHVAIVFTRYMLLAMEQRQNEDQRTLGELFFFLVDEMADITFNRSLCILMEALMASLQGIFKLSDEQLNAFTADFEARLPEYLRKALHLEAAAA